MYRINDLDLGELIAVAAIHASFIYMILEILL